MIAQEGVNIAAAIATVGMVARDRMWATILGIVALIRNKRSVPVSKSVGTVAEVRIALGPVEMVAPLRGLRTKSTKSKPVSNDRLLGWLVALTGCSAEERRRWVEEWRAERAALGSRRARWRFMLSLCWGVPALRRANREPARELR